MPEVCVRALVHICRMTCNWKTALMAAIYSKSLRISNAASHGKGATSNLNLMSMPSIAALPKVALVLLTAWT